jgi:hypothetical protein
MIQNVSLYWNVQKYFGQGLTQADISAVAMHLYWNNLQFFLKKTISDNSDKRVQFFPQKILTQSKRSQLTAS